MKRVLFLISISLLLVVSGFGQSKFGGFFKPVDELVSKTKGEATPQWLFRPYLSLTGMAVQFGGGETQVNSFNSVGLGVSYDRLTLVNDKAYCNLSVGASFLSQVELNGVINPKFGLAGTVSVFNKMFGVGIGYLDKHPMLLLNFSYSF